MLHLNRLRTTLGPALLLLVALGISYSLGRALERSVPAEQARPTLRDQERQQAYQQARLAADRWTVELWRSLASLEALPWIESPTASQQTRLQARYPALLAAGRVTAAGTALLVERDPVAARQLVSLPPAQPPASSLALELLPLASGEAALLARQGDRPETAAVPGQTVLLLSLPDLLAASQFDQLTAAGYDYELSLQTPTHPSLVVARTGAPLLEPVRVVLNYPEQTWRLAIAPATGWQYPARSPWGLLLLGLLLGLALLRWLRPALWGNPQTQFLNAANRQLAEHLRGEQQAQTTLSQELAATRAQLADSQQQLKATQRQLQARQAQLIQSESNASLGKLVAGILQEIESPTNFIHGNLDHAQRYALDLLHLADLYQARCPAADPDLQTLLDTIDLTFVRTDLPSLLTSLQVSTRRIREIVRALRSFSLEDVEMQPADLHASLERSLLVLQSRLRGKMGRDDIMICRDYGQLPPVICYSGQIDQVFLNLLTNAIDALAEAPSPREIHLQTALEGEWAMVRIRDTGPGIPREVQLRLFEPFFTTKPVGSGTGLGLTICHQIIVERHQGRLTCCSEPGAGAEFAIALPAPTAP